MGVQRGRASCPDRAALRLQATCDRLQAPRGAQHPANSTPAGQHFIKTGGRLLQGPQILLAATTMSPALVQAAAAPAVAVAGRPAAVGGRSAAAGAPLRPAARSAARQQRRRGGSVQAVASPVKPAAGAKAGGKAAISAEEAHKLYHDMVLGREFEEMCAQMYYRGKMFGFVHLYSGQEAVSTGAPCPPPLLACCSPALLPVFLLFVKLAMCFHRLWNAQCLQPAEAQQSVVPSAAVSGVSATPRQPPALLAPLLVDAPLCYSLAPTHPPACSVSPALPQA